MTFMSSLAPFSLSPILTTQTTTLSFSMATTSLQSIHHHHSLLHHHHHHSDTLPSPLSSSLSFKPTSTFSLKLSSLHFSLYSASTNITPTTSSSSSATSFDLLKQHLSDQDFRQADEETRRLLIILAGESAQKRGYVFFSETQFISESDLQTIDGLWRKFSDNKFGYSVQKRIWEKVNKDFTKFFLKVGWMKKLDTEIEQFNYKAFPNEFIWELKEDTPEGHLPLTNALRGTQLLNSILMHPGFQSMEEENGIEDVKEMETQGGLEEMRQISKPLSKRLFKSDYSF